MVATPDSKISALDKCRVKSSMLRNPDLCQEKYHIVLANRFHALEVSSDVPDEISDSFTSGGIASKSGIKDCGKQAWYLTPESHFWRW